MATKALTHHTRSAPGVEGVICGGAIVDDALPRTSDAVNSIGVRERTNRQINELGMMSEAPMMPLSRIAFDNTG